MNRRKTWIIALAGILLAAAALALVLLRRSAESGPALLQLLPAEADLYALVDFAALQRNPAVRELLADPPELSMEYDYRRFVQESGFRYQDDLRQLALARLGSNYVGAARIAIDRSRMLQYLQTANYEGTERTEDTERSEGTEGTEGTEKTEVLGTTVFVFGRVRPFRLALPAPDLAVFTIGEDNRLIEKVLALHANGSARDSAASELTVSGELSRFSQGNAFSLLLRSDRWSSPGLPQAESGPFRFGGPLLQGSRALYVAMQSQLAQLDFQVENLCLDEAAAARFTSMMQSLLVLLRAAPVDDPDGSQQKLAILLQDINVQQVSDSVLLRWQWDAETLRLLE